MLRCVFAVILFFSLLVSGLYAEAGEPAMAQHVVAQEQVQISANACTDGSTNKQPTIVGSACIDAEADGQAEGDIETCGLCNSTASSLNFGPKPVLAIPFTPVLFLQPHPDGLRRPPRIA
jgi:hypothetical protein